MACRFIRFFNPAGYLSLFPPLLSACTVRSVGSVVLASQSGAPQVAVCCRITRHAHGSSGPARSYPSTLLEGIHRRLFNIQLICALWLALLLPFSGEGNPATKKRDNNWSLLGDQCEPLEVARVADSSRTVQNPGGGLCGRVLAAPTVTPPLPASVWTEILGGN